MPKQQQQQHQQPHDRPEQNNELPRSRNQFKQHQLQPQFRPSPRDPEAPTPTTPTFSNFGENKDPANYDYYANDQINSIGDDLEDEEDSIEGEVEQKEGLEENTTAFPRREQFAELSQFVEPAPPAGIQTTAQPAEVEESEQSTRSPKEFVPEDPDKFAPPSAITGQAAAPVDDASEQYDDEFHPANPDYFAPGVQHDSEIDLVGSQEKEEENESEGEEMMSYENMSGLLESSLEDQVLQARLEREMTINNPRAAQQERQNLVPVQPEVKNELQVEPTAAGGVSDYDDDYNSQGITSFGVISNSYGEVTEEYENSLEEQTNADLKQGGFGENDYLYSFEDTVEDKPTLHYDDFAVAEPESTLPPVPEAVPVEAPEVSPIKPLQEGGRSQRLEDSAPPDYLGPDSGSYNSNWDHNYDGSFEANFDHNFQPQENNEDFQSIADFQAEQKEKYGSAELPKAGPQKPRNDFGGNQNSDINLHGMNGNFQDVNSPQHFEQNNNIHPHQNRGVSNNNDVQHLGNNVNTRGFANFPKQNSGDKSKNFVFNSFHNGFPQQQNVKELQQQNIQRFVQRQKQQQQQQHQEQPHQQQPHQQQQHQQQQHQQQQQHGFQGQQHQQQLTFGSQQQQQGQQNSFQAGQQYQQLDFGPRQQHSTNNYQDQSNYKQEVRNQNPAIPQQEPPPINYGSNQSSGQGKTTQIFSISTPIPPTDYAVPEAPLLTEYGSQSNSNSLSNPSVPNPDYPEETAPTVDYDYDFGGIKDETTTIPPLSGYVTHSLDTLPNYNNFGGQPVTTAPNYNDFGSDPVTPGFDYNEYGALPVADSAPNYNDFGAHPVTVAPNFIDPNALLGYEVRSNPHNFEYQYQPHPQPYAPIHGVKHTHPAIASDLPEPVVGFQPEYQQQPGQVLPGYNSPDSYARPERPPTAPRPENGPRPDIPDGEGIKFDSANSVDPDDPNSYDPFAFQQARKTKAKKGKKRNKSKKTHEALRAAPGTFVGLSKEDLAVGGEEDQLGSQQSPMPSIDLIATPAPAPLPEDSEFSASGPVPAVTQASAGRQPKSNDEEDQKENSLTASSSTQVRRNMLMNIILRPGGGDKARALPRPKVEVSSEGSNIIIVKMTFPEDENIQGLRAYTPTEPDELKKFARITDIIPNSKEVLRIKASSIEDQDEEQEEQSLNGPFDAFTRDEINSGFFFSNREPIAQSTEITEQEEADRQRIKKEIQLQKSSLDTTGRPVLWGRATTKIVPGNRYNDVQLRDDQKSENSQIQQNYSIDSNSLAGGITTQSSVQEQLQQQGDDASTLLNQLVVVTTSAPNEYATTLRPNRPPRTTFPPRSAPPAEKEQEPPAQIGGVLHNLTPPKLNYDNWVEIKYDPEAEAEKVVIGKDALHYIQDPHSAARPPHDFYLAQVLPPTNSQPHQQRLTVPPPPRPPPRPLRSKFLQQPKRTPRRQPHHSNFFLAGGSGIHQKRPHHHHPQQQRHSESTYNRLKRRLLDTF